MEGGKKKPLMARVRKENEKNVDTAVHSAAPDHFTHAESGGVVAPRGQSQISADLQKPLIRGEQSRARRVKGSELERGGEWRGGERRREATWTSSQGGRKEGVGTEKR